MYLLPNVVMRVIQVLCYIIMPTSVWWGQVLLCSVVGEEFIDFTHTTHSSPQKNAAAVSYKLLIVY